MVYMALCAKMIGGDNISRPIKVTITNNNKAYYAPITPKGVKKLPPFASF